MEVISLDCLDVMKEMSEGSVDCIVTSPPYFNARDYDGSPYPDYPSYVATLTDWIRGMVRVLVDGRMLCINVSAVIEPRASRNSRSRRWNIPGDVHAICNGLGMWFAEDIIWVKPEGAAVNRNQRFSLDRHPMQWRANPCTEHILVYQKPTRKSNDEIIRTHDGTGRITGDYDRSDVWYINPTQVAGHPAPFPVELPERLIRYYTWPGETVLDPFAGSGTTGIACANLGRQFIGVEKNPDYANLAHERITAARAQLTMAVA